MSATMLLIIIALAVIGAVICLVCSFMMPSGGASMSGSSNKTTTETSDKSTKANTTTKKTNAHDDEYNKFSALLRYNNVVISQDEALKLFKNIGLTGVTYKAKNRFGIFSAVSISGVQINVEDTNQYREIRQFLHDYDEFNCTVEVTENGKNAIVIFEAIEGENDHENILSGTEVLDAVQKGVLTGKAIEFVLLDSSGSLELANYNLKRHNEEYFMLPMLLGKEISGASDYRMAAMNNDIKIVYHVKEIER